MLPFEDDRFDAVVCDPPYFDNAQHGRPGFFVPYWEDEQGELLELSELLPGPLPVAASPGPVEAPEDLAF